MTELFSNPNFDEEIITKKNIKNRSQIKPVKSKRVGMIGKFKATIYGIIENNKAKYIENEKEKVFVDLGKSGAYTFNRNMFY